MKKYTKDNIIGIKFICKEESPRCVYSITEKVPDDRVKIEWTIFDHTIDGGGIFETAMVLDSLNKRTWIQVDGKPKSQFGWKI